MKFFEDDKIYDTDTATHVATYNSYTTSPHRKPILMFTEELYMSPKGTLFLVHTFEQEPDKEPRITFKLHSLSQAKRWGWDTKNAEALEAAGIIFEEG